MNTYDILNEDFEALDMQIMNKKAIMYQDSPVISTLLGIDNRPFESSVVPGSHRHKDIIKIRADKLNENFDL